MLTLVRKANSMKPFMMIVVVAAAAALSGCLSSEEIAARDDAKCRSYGARKGTDTYVRCRIAQDEIRALRRAATAEIGLYSTGPWGRPWY